MRPRPRETNNRHSNTCATLSPSCFPVDKVVLTLRTMVRTDLTLYSQYWTPSSRCAPSYRRPSVTTNVSLAYTNSGKAGLCCSLRNQQKRKESFLISKKEKLLSQSQTSGGNLPSVTPLLPQRQQARRLTKMQGCYSPNIHCQYRYKGNLTQYSYLTPILKFNAGR